MDINQFSKLVCDNFTNDITDRVFLTIENDRELLKKYLEIVAENGLIETNSHLGMFIKKYFDLNNNEECDTPKSKIIQSYTKHTRSN